MSFNTKQQISVSMLQATESKEESFYGIFAENALVILTPFLRKREQAGANGCGKIPGRFTAHRASMYGRMTLLTRQIFA